MKKLRILIVVSFLAVLLFPLASLAFTYSDGEVSVNLPEGEYTYYYTPENTNFAGTILAQALAEDGLVAKTGVYDSSGDLRYALDIEKIPVNEAAEEGVLLKGRADLIKTQALDTFTFGDIEEESVLGKDALALHGQSQGNPDYSKDVYVMKEGANLFVITLFYRNTDEGESQAQALSQMNTIRFGPGLPGTKPSAAQQSAHPPDVVQSVPAEDRPEQITESMPAETAAAEQTAAPDLRQSGIGPAMDVPLWVWIAIAAGGGAVILILVLSKQEKAPKPNIKTTEIYKEVAPNIPHAPTAKTKGKPRHMGGWGRKKPAHYKKRRK